MFLFVFNNNSAFKRYFLNALKYVNVKVRVWVKIISIILPCSQEGLLCWPPLERVWQDWEGLQLGLWWELLHWREFLQSSLGWCHWLVLEHWESWVGHYLISNDFIWGLLLLHRSDFHDVHWPGLLHHIWGTVLSPAYWRWSWSFHLSCLLLGLTCSSLFRSAVNSKQ